MEPIKISTLQAHIHDFVLRNQKEYNPDFNDELNEDEIKKLQDAFGVKDIKELQNVGLDTFSYVNGNQENVENSEETNTGNTEIPEGTTLEEPSVSDDENIQARNTQFQNIGTAAERLATNVGARHVLDDSSENSVITAMYKSLISEADYYEQSGDKDSVSKLVNIAGKLYSIEQLAKEYIRDNAINIKDYLAGGQTEDIVFPDGTKLIITQNLKVKGNNNSADSVEYVKEGSTIPDERQREKKDDISKLIGGFVYAVEAGTDKLTLIGKVDFTYQKNFNTYVAATYKNKTKDGWEYNFSSVADLAIDMDDKNNSEREIRGGAAAEIKKNDFSADATFYGYNENHTNGDRDYSINVTGRVGYKNFRVGGFYEASDASNAFGGIAQWNGSTTLNNGLFLAADVEISGEKEQYKGQADEYKPSTFEGNFRTSGYAKFNADKFDFKAGAMFHGTLVHNLNSADENNKTDFIHAASVYTEAKYTPNKQKGASYSVMPKFYFIQKECVPSVTVSVLNPLSSGVDISLEYCAPTIAEKQFESKGTFSLFVKKHF